MVVARESAVMPEESWFCVASESVRALIVIVDVDVFVARSTTGG